MCSISQPLAVLRAVVTDPGEIEDAEGPVPGRRSDHLLIKRSSCRATTAVSNRSWKTLSSPNSESVVEKDEKDRPPYLRFQWIATRQFHVHSVTRALRPRQVTTMIEGVVEVATAGTG